MKPKRNDRIAFDQIVSVLKIVRAGRLGVIEFGPPTTLAETDPLAVAARVWERLEADSSLPHSHSSAK